MLQYPPDDQMLFKVMKVEHLINSIERGYLHFNRVDSYKDFDHADLNDGAQLPADRPGNALPYFQKDPSFNGERYYDQARQRTYAYCLSLQDSDFIWARYGSDSQLGKVGIVFHFGKLRAFMNETLLAGRARLPEVFSLNYGLVEYIDWHTHRANEPHLPAPERYAYLKDKAYEEEAELRITISAPGIFTFNSDTGSEVFPPARQFGFDFHQALAAGAIQCVEAGPGSDPNHLLAEFRRLRFNPAPC